MVFWGGYLPSLSINYVAMSKDMGKRLPQLYYIKMKISFDLGFIAIGVDLTRSSLLPAGIFIDFMLACCRRFTYSRARRTDGVERVKLYSGKTRAGERSLL